MEAAAERGETPVGFTTASGEYVSAREQGGVLPDGVFGHHRWIATAGYVLTDDEARMETRAQGGSGERQYLDATRLFVFAIACYDCEEPLGTIQPGTFCAGEPSPEHRRNEEEAWEERMRADGRGDEVR